MKQLFLLLASLLLFNACVSHNHAKEYPIHTFQQLHELDDSKKQLVTKALPGFVFRTFIGKTDILKLSDQFIFFNDSVFACLPLPKDSLDAIDYLYILMTQTSPTEKIDRNYITGKYAVLNDSIIEVLYCDGNEALVFKLEHNEFSVSDEFTVDFKKSAKVGEELNPFTRNLRWEWMANDSIIMDNRRCFPEVLNPRISRLWWYNNFNELRISQQAVNGYPEIIVFNPYDPLFTLRPDFSPGEEVGKSLDSKPKRREFKYYINIANPAMNYLDVTDVRKSAECINNLTVYLGEILPWRWYPDRLRFKKKADKLILLNHDGSESPLSLDILLQ